MLRLPLSYMTFLFQVALPSNLNHFFINFTLHVYLLLQFPKYVLF